VGKFEVSGGFILRYVFGPFETNCYAVCSGGDVLVIDPSSFDEKEKQFLYEEIFSQGRLKLILNTHGHFDHIAGNSFLKERFKSSKIAISKNDSFCLKDPEKNFSASFGIPVVSATQDFFLEEGLYINVGKIQLKVLETPGHTKGSVSLAGDGFVFTGDTLFAGSVGIAKEYKGAYDEMINSINEKLFVLSSDSVIFPGHGGESSIREEREFNSFLND